MKKTYIRNMYRLDLKTRVGRQKTASIVALISIFIIQILRGLWRVGGGDIFKGAKRMKPLLHMLPEDYQRFLVASLIILILGFICIQIVKTYYNAITITYDAIVSEYPNRKYITWIPIFKKIPGCKIQFEELTKVWSGVFFQQGSYFLITNIEGNDSKIELNVGFIGYFEILSEIEKCCPEAEWDGSTRLILDNHRNGIPLYKAENKLIKESKKEFKLMVPSWRRRLRIKMKHTEKGIYHKDLLETLEQS